MSLNLDHSWKCLDADFYNYNQTSREGLGYNFNPILDVRIISADVRWMSLKIKNISDCNFYYTKVGEFSKSILEYIAEVNCVVRVC